MRRDGTGARGRDADLEHKQRGSLAQADWETGAATIREAAASVKPDELIRTIERAGEFDQDVTDARLREELVLTASPWQAVESDPPLHHARMSARWSTRLRGGRDGGLSAAALNSTDSSPGVPRISRSAIATHRQLVRMSSQSRHLVATQSGHWIQFDEPDLVVAAIRESSIEPVGRTQRETSNSS